MLQKNKDRIIKKFEDRIGMPCAEYFELNKNDKSIADISRVLDTTSLAASEILKDFGMFEYYVAVGRERQRQYKVKTFPNEETKQTI